MRNCRVPIGWLKPIEFVILSYLCCCRSHGCDCEVIPAGSVARAVHITVDTAKKYLSALANRGLVPDEYSLAPNFRCADGKKFFALPNEIFLLKLPPSAFVAYAYCVVYLTT